MQLELTTQQALWFLPVVAPICAYAAYTDLKGMKIPNRATDALLAAFVVVGFFALPFSDYLWRFAHFGAVLAAGFLLNMARAMGAGDAKFLASAAPYVAVQDADVILFLMAACVLSAFAIHRIARATPLHRLAPHWESWTTGKRFPMGFPFGAMMVIYLALPFLI